MSVRRSAPPSGLRFRPTLAEMEDRAVPAAAFAVAGNTLIPFDTDATATPSAAIAITGLNAGDRIDSIDFRPQNGLLYGLGYNPTAGTVRLYQINPASGAATALGAAGQYVDASGAAVRVGVDGNTTVGIDFNPTVDRVRVVTSSGQNFRMNPNTGAFVDGDLGGAAGSVAGLNMDGNIKGGAAGASETAYTNNTQNARVTTQYTVSTDTGQLLIQNPPNSGTQTMGVPITLGGIQIPFTDVGGFDIMPGVNVTAANAKAAGNGFLALTVAGQTFLYTIDLTTGATTLLPSFPGGQLVDAVAVRTSQTLLSAAGTGPGVQAQVQAFNPDGSSRFTVTPFGAFTGGTNVAVGDVNGDGISDVIVGARVGGGPVVSVFDGATGNQIRSFFAFDQSFRGGVDVATGDYNADGRADIVVGAGKDGGPVVSIFDGTTGAVIRSFFAFDQSFRGGVTVTTRDTNNDGVPEVVVGTGVGGGPVVAVFNGATGAQLTSFFAFDQSFRGGIDVAAGRSNALNVVAVGASTGGGPVVSLFDLSNGSQIRTGFAFDPAFRGGVSVGLTQDGLLLATPGADGGPLLNVNEVTNGAQLRQVSLFDPNGRTGLSVA